MMEPEKRTVYEEEIQKLTKQMQEKSDKPKKITKKEEALQESLQYFDEVKTGEILNKLGLTRYCCRRHMIGHVDMMKVI